jgi:hypothetical protein
LVDIIKVMGDRSEIRRTQFPSGDYFLGILEHDFIYRGMFFRRKDFLNIGMYDESMRYREDWDLNIRMFERKKAFAYVNEPLYLYTWRDGSITTGNRAKVLDYTAKVLRKHHKRLADAGSAAVAKIYAANSWDLAREYLYSTRDYKRALMCARESIAYDCNLGRLMHPLSLENGRIR